MKRPLIEILNDRPAPVPDYPNDWAATMELWEQLETDGFIVDLENGVRGQPIISVRGTEENRLIDFIVRSETAKRAITRAFILARETPDVGQ